MIGEIPWPKYGLDMASPKMDVRTSALTPGSYHEQLSEPTIT